MVWLILLDSGAVVGSDIPGCTVIGHRNTIGYNAVVGVKCQDMKYKVVILLLTLCPKCNFGSNAVTVDSFLFVSVGQVECPSIVFRVKLAC